MPCIVFDNIFELFMTEKKAQEEEEHQNGKFQVEFPQLWEGLMELWEYVLQ